MRRTRRIAHDAALPSDLRKEEFKIEDDIADYDFWPMLALEISFRL